MAEIIDIRLMPLYLLEVLGYTMYISAVYFGGVYMQGAKFSCSFVSFLCISFLLQIMYPRSSFYAYVLDMSRGARLTARLKSFALLKAFGFSFAGL